MYTILSIKFGNHLPNLMLRQICIEQRLKNRKTRRNLIEGFSIKIFNDSHGT